MSDRKDWRCHDEQKDCDRMSAAETTTRAREQASSSPGRPDVGTLTGDEKRETITLKNGAVVDAREAVSMHGWLVAMMEAQPAMFGSLLALTLGKPNEAGPVHGKDLREGGFLAPDGSVVPVVAALINNCYEVTGEGPVMVPLRLQSKSDLSVAQRAEEGIERRWRRFLSGPPPGGGPSVE